MERGSGPDRNLSPTPAGPFLSETTCRAYRIQEPILVEAIRAVVFRSEPDDFESQHFRIIRELKVADCLWAGISDVKGS